MDGLVKKKHGSGHTVSNSLHKIVAWALTVKLFSDACHRTSSITSQHWFRWGLGAVRQQAITWAIVDPNQYYHMASLGEENSAETWYNKYSAVPSHTQFSLKYSQQTPHSSPESASYGVSFVSQSLILCSTADLSSDTRGWGSAKKKWTKTHAIKPPYYYSIAGFFLTNHLKNTLHG